MNAEKERVIDDILANPTYMKDSGLVQNLRAALAKLSLSNLRNLLLILSLRE